VSRVCNQGQVVTEGERADHEDKVRKVMNDHLVSLGYPKMSNEQIMSQLKPMWIKIEEAGLIVGDMNFEAFCAHANNAFMIAQVNEIMGI